MLPSTPRRCAPFRAPIRCSRCPTNTRAIKFPWSSGLIFAASCGWKEEQNILSARGSDLSRVRTNGCHPEEICPHVFMRANNEGSAFAFRLSNDTKNGNGRIIALSNEGFFFGTNSEDGYKDENNENF